MNSVGVGAFFNLTNFGQMYSYHILLLPIAVVLLVSLHVLLVRRNGVVPPFELEAADSRRPGVTTPGESPRASRSDRLRHPGGRPVMSLGSLLNPRTTRSPGKGPTRPTTWSKSCASRSA